MKIKSPRTFLSLGVLSAAFLIIAASAAKIILQPEADIYNLFASQRMVYTLCALFILYCILKWPREFLKPDIAGLICALAISFLVSLSGLYDRLLQSGNLHKLSPVHVFSVSPVKYILLFFVFLIFFCLLFIASRAAWFSVSLRNDTERKSLVLRLLGFTAVYAVVFLLLYLPCYPYLSSSDTLNQWQQIHGELPYNRIHAIGHTILLKAILSLHDNYSAVIIFHIIAVTLIYILFSAHFFKKGLSFPIIAFIFSMALFITCKYVPAYFYPWKDTVSAVCLAIICFIIIKYRETDKISLGSAVVLGISLAGCMIFRLNGVVALIICGLYFAVSFITRKYYRQLLAMLAAIIVSFGAVNAYADRVLQPVDYENGFSIQVFASGIAAMVKSGELSEDELDMVDQLISVEWMKENYESGIYKLPLIWYPDNSPEITENPELAMFNSKFVLDLGENKWDVVKLYFTLMPRHFTVCVLDVLGSLHLMWSTSPVFVYSYAFCILLLLYLSLKAGLRLPDYVVFLPSACNTLSIMISTITNEKRYLLPTFMLMPVYFLYIIKINNEHRKTSAVKPIIVN